MDKAKWLQLQLRICLVAIVLSIIIGVLVAPMQYAKPPASFKVDEDRELLINHAREELINSKTQSELKTRVKYYNSKDYIFKDPVATQKNKKEQQAYSQEVSRQRGFELLDDNPNNGSVGEVSAESKKVKNKPSVKVKTKTLSDSFMKGFEKKEKYEKLE